MKLSMKSVIFVSLMAFTLLPGSVRADGGATRIATANPAKIFQQMRETNDKKKAGAAELAALQTDAEAKAKEIDTMANILKTDYRKGTADYNTKMQEILKKRIDFQVWQELKKAEMARKGKEDTKAVFVKIQEAIAAVAAEKKIDLVITETNNDFPEDLDAVTPEQLQQILDRRNVLYAAKGVDISSEVTVRLDAAYKPK